MTPRAELKELAEKATPGERIFRNDNFTHWLETFDGHTLIHWQGFDASHFSIPQRVADGEFIAACDRETVLALLAEIERLERVINSAEHKAREGIIKIAEAELSKGSFC